MGIVSYGPIDCRISKNREPDVFTDVRSFTNWVRSETSSYDKSESATVISQKKDISPSFDSTSVSLVPQCGDDFCFLAEGGDCTFINSIYTKCADKISCDKELVPTSGAFVLGGKKTFIASSVGAVGSIAHPGRENMRCTKWNYSIQNKRWRCQRFKRISRKRRQAKILDFEQLVCPVLSCIDRKVLGNEWSTPLHAETCRFLKNINDSVTPSLAEEKG